VSGFLELLRRLPVFGMHQMHQTATTTTPDTSGAASMAICVWCRHRSPAILTRHGWSKPLQTRVTRWQGSQLKKQRPKHGYAYTSSRAMRWTPGPIGPPESSLPEREHRYFPNGRPNNRSYPQYDITGNTGMGLVSLPWLTRLASLPCLPVYDGSHARQW
jgi:hypothetical protein